jgi:hypothetical protein
MKVSLLIFVFFFLYVSSSPVAEHYDKKEIIDAVSRAMEKYKNGSNLEELYVKYKSKTENKAEHSDGDHHNHHNHSKNKLKIFINELKARTTPIIYFLGTNEFVARVNDYLVLELPKKHEMIFDRITRLVSDLSRTIFLQTPDQKNLIEENSVDLEKLTNKMLLGQAIKKVYE